MPSEPHEPAPPADLGAPPHREPAGGGSLWPDRREPPNRRATVLGLVVGLAFVLVPLLGPWVDVVVAIPGLFPALGVGFALQTVLDLTRPDPTDRFAVVAYRVAYFGTPVVLAVGAVLVAGP